MSEYHFSISRKPHRIRLPEWAVKKTFRVEVNGKSTQVELLEGFNYGKPFFVKVGGKLYRVEVDRGDIDGSITVKVDGEAYSVRSENKSRISSPALKLTMPVVEKKNVKARALDRGVIVASMPGKVVLLRVKVGDCVHVGDLLLALESMKMENEIVSPVNGIVKEVRVSEGTVVNMGETMVVINET